MGRILQEWIQQRLDIESHNSKQYPCAMTAVQTMNFILICQVIIVVMYVLIKTHLTEAMDAIMDSINACQKEDLNGICQDFLILDHQA
jgi:type VI protein secretion system component VasF